ncbi:hypothetical protein [Aureimonas sp. AU22]|uniref:hypothetical protein n=1 Tax=Aureimonas sp. AU22 TaxID=1638162 RepID=UPI0007863305|nr:hypothetical protein [Aureimonas sp. AU22]
MKATNDNVGGLAMALVKLRLVTNDSVCDAMEAVDHLTDAELDELERRCSYVGVDMDLTYEAIRCERLIRKDRPDLGGDVA